MPCVVTQALWVSYSATQLHRRGQTLYRRFAQGPLGYSRAPGASNPGARVLGSLPKEQVSQGAAMEHYRLLSGVRIATVRFALESWLARLRFGAPAHCRANHARRVD